jgi:hypothetical protein
MLKQANMTVGVPHCLKPRLNVPNNATHDMQAASGMREKIGSRAVAGERAIAGIVDCDILAAPFRHAPEPAVY